MSAAQVLNSQSASIFPDFQGAAAPKKSYPPRPVVYGRGDAKRPFDVPSRDDRAFLNTQAQRLLSPSHAVVFRSVLACANNSDGACFPSHDAIAHRIVKDGRRRLSERTVRRALRSAEDVGLLTWDRRLRKVYDRRTGQCLGSRRTSNAYRFIRKPTADDYRPAPARNSRAAKVAMVRKLISGFASRSSSRTSTSTRAEALAPSAAVEDDRPLDDFLDGLLARSRANPRGGL